MRRLMMLFAALPALAFAGPMDPAPAAAASNIPGVYQKYAPPPTRVPTPNTQGASVAHFEMHKDTMALALKAGAAVPLGDLAKNNTAGWSAGLDVVYGASALVDAAFGLSYASMPYKLTVSAQPQTSLGLGVRAILKALQDRKLSVNFSGGMGYYFENVAVDVDKGPDPANPNLRLTEPGYKSAGGMGFLLGAAVNFQFTPNFAAAVTADAVQVSLGGGTSDTPLYLTPNLTVSYTF